MWGAFSPITGDSVYMETPNVNKDNFVQFMDILSKRNPRELKIVVIYNAAFHSTKNMKLPDNIRLMRLPAYSPELNPAEKMWQWFKARTRNKCFDNLEMLENHITSLVNKTPKSLVKSITNYKCYQSILNDMCF